MLIQTLLCRWCYSESAFILSSLCLYGAPFRTAIITCSRTCSHSQVRPVATKFPGPVRRRGHFLVSLRRRKLHVVPSDEPSTYIRVVDLSIPSADHLCCPYQVLQQAASVTPFYAKTISTAFVGGIHVSLVDEDAQGGRHES
jgi:hypothetical protein